LYIIVENLAFFVSKIHYIGIFSQLVWCSSGIHWWI